MAEQLDTWNQKLNVLLKQKLVQNRNIKTEVEMYDKNESYDVLNKSVSK